MNYQPSRSLAAFNSFYFVSSESVVSSSSSSPSVRAVVSSRRTHLFLRSYPHDARRSPCELIRSSRTRLATPRRPRPPVYYATAAPNLPNNNSYFRKNDDANNDNDRRNNNMFSSNDNNAKDRQNRQQSQSQPDNSQQQRQQHHDTDEEFSYLQCPQCKAVYQVDPDELDDAPRVVACSSCLHEWYASDDAFLWGDDMALNALIEARKPSAPAYVKKRTVPVGSRYSKYRSKDERNYGSESNNETDSRNSSNRSESETSSSMFNQSDNQQTNNRRKQSTNDEPGTDSEVIEDDDPEQIDDSNSDSDAMVMITETNSRTTPSMQQPQDRISNSVSPTQSNENYSMNTAERGSNDMNGDTKSNQSSEKDEYDDDFEAGRDNKPYVIFVGNLSFRATEEDLYRAFSGYGLVERCLVPSAVNGSPRGYGFVKMANSEDSVKAIRSLQGSSILGRDVALSRARRVFDDVRRGLMDNRDRDNRERERGDNYRNQRQEQRQQFQGSSGSSSQREQSQSSSRRKTNRYQSQQQEHQEQRQQPKQQLQPRQRYRDSSSSSRQQHPQSRQRHSETSSSSRHGRHMNEGRNNRDSDNGDRNNRPWYRRNNSDTSGRDSSHRVSNR